MPERADYPLALLLTAEVSSLPHLKAAVCAGAHSVCITYSGDEERRSQDAFPLIRLRDGVRFCHERGARVYVCLRRQYSQGDIPLLETTLTQLNACGVDALRVGDLGTAWLARHMMPHMPLHALNGLCLENEMTGFIADRLGFDRVCLSTSARLCRLKPHPGIDYEATAFAPGCGSAAGMCTMALFGTHPFDRQQPCTAPCTKPHTGGEKDYVLCPGSVSLLDTLTALPHRGVSQLYLDCRTLSEKETEGLVGMFRRAIEAPPKQDETKKAPRLLGVEQPVHGFLTHETAGELYSGEPPYRRTATVLDTVMQAAAQPYVPPTLKTVDVAFSVAARSGQPLTVTAMDRDGNPVCVEGSILSNTHWQGGSDAALKTLMYQTGATPYSCIAVKLRVEKGCRVEEEELARLRDRALRQLTALRGDRAVTPVKAIAPEPFLEAQGPARVAVQLSERGQLSPQLLQLDIDCIYLPLSEIVSQDSGYRRMIENTKIELCAVMPQAPDSDLIPNLKAQLTLASELGIDTVLCGDVGSASVALSMGFRPRGDWNLWAGSTLAFRQLQELGFISCVVGFDTPLEQIKSISHILQTEVYAYGRLPLTVTPVCPLGKEKCPTGKCTIYNSDREPYPVRQDGIGRCCTVYSAKKLVSGQRPTLLSLGADRLRLRFVGENSQECYTITKQFLDNRLTMPNDYITGHSEPPKRSLLQRLLRRS